MALAALAWSEACVIVAGMLISIPAFIAFLIYMEDRK
jgi:hypothetical protein